MQKRHRFDFERQCKTALGAAPPLIKTATLNVSVPQHQENRVGTGAPATPAPQERH